MKNWLDNNISDKKKWYLFIIAAIFIIGFVLRTIVFAYNRPLWLDECQVALSILNRNIFGYFSTLVALQSAPPLFMMFVKLFSLILGTKEFALRMFPFLCGLIAIPVFYKFSKQFLIRKWSVIIASFLFAVNRELIYYSQELKQYSSDVLFFMLAFLILNKLSLKNLSIKKTVLYSIGISILPLFSISACFVIGGWFIREIIVNKFKNLKNLIIFSIPVAIINILYYIYVIEPQHRLQIGKFEEFWSQGFINFNPIYDFNMLKQNLMFFFSPTAFTLLKIVLLLIGVYYVFRRIKSLRNILLIAFFILMFIFSYLHMYPIYQRVALYTLPLLIVFITKPFDFYSIKKKWFSLITAVMFLCAFWGYNPSYFIKFDNFNPLNFRSHPNNARALMKKLIKKYNGKSCVIVNSASAPEYFYYAHYYNFEPKCFKGLVYPLEADNLQQLNKLKNGEYWFYYSFDYIHCPVKQLTKKWASDYKIIYEYEKKDNYLLNMKKY